MSKFLSTRENECHGKLQTRRPSCTETRFGKCCFLRNGRVVSNTYAYIILQHTWNGRGSLNKSSSIWTEINVLDSVYFANFYTFVLCV